MADWSAFGSREPDTEHDASGGFMFAEPNTEFVDKLYLSVVPVWGHVYTGVVNVNSGPWINPNVGALGSRIYPAGPMQFDAMFGSWVDCNRDGYIGHAESALFEYPVQTPGLDLSLCPVGAYAGDSNLYNQQGWVTEFRWISNDHLGRAKGDNGKNRDQRVIVDGNATIWGDFGVPGNTMGREVCPQDFPRGTTEQTGRMLNWLDCFFAHRLWDSSNAALTTVGLGFDNEQRFDQDAHPANQDTLGADDGDQTAMRVWDCSAERQELETGQDRVFVDHQNVSSPHQQEPYTLPSFQVIDEDGHVNVTYWQGAYRNNEWRESESSVSEPTLPRPVTPGSPNTGGSVAGTYNHTVAGWNTDGCGSRARVYDQLETNDIPESALAKNRVTVNFQYYEEQRNGANARGMAFYGAQAYPVIRNRNTNGGGTHWYGSGPSPSELGENGPTAPQLVRTSDLQPDGGIYWTFYANLSGEALSTGIQVPGLGLYGNEWCSKSTDPALNGGFVCDADKWYRAPDGTDVGGFNPQGNFEYRPAPGVAYHVRDVDCYDGSLVAGVPAYASLAAVSSDGPCPTVG